MKIMNKLNIVGQKIKGEAQQIKGKIESASGQHIKGTIDTIRGKTNVAVAEIKKVIDKS